MDKIWIKGHGRAHSKWKAAYIHNCLKKGETPIPGPVGGDSEEKETNEGGAGGWAQPPSNVDQVQPNLPSSTVVPPPVAQQPAMVISFYDFISFLINRFWK